jgi:hypothetical protein
MVIANSDSNTTLVSLNNNGDNDKHVSVDQNIVVMGQSGLLRYVEPSASTTAQHSFKSNECDSDGIPTELLVSVPDSSSSSSTEEYVPLYLPPQNDSLSQKNDHDLDVDEYISRNYYNIDENDCHPYELDKPQPPSSLLRGAEKLKESREQLMASKRQRICTGSREHNRLLYVAQGERANATSAQYDVLMSDKATTCHILAFRSRISSTDNDSEVDSPLTSLTHLDGAQYEECVREMIQEHIDYHQRDNSGKRSRRKRPKFMEEEKKSDDCLVPNDGKKGCGGQQITIDIHVMGGFNDIDSSSSNITEWLIRLLARMAQEFKDERASVQMVVKTLVVSSSNNELDDRNNDSPIGRGFGIDLKTGEVFLTGNQDDPTSSGPVPVLRSVRLWSRCCSGNETDGLQPHKLSVVHTIKDVEDVWELLGVEENDGVREEFGLFWVQPFRFRSISDVDALLGLPDELLLQYTSTSPDVEEAGFCNDVRASMEFLKYQCTIKKEDGRSYFGKSFNRPMVFAIRQRRSTASEDPKKPETQQREKWNRISL